jgi:hypothetical protein
MPLHLTGTLKIQAPFKPIQGDSSRFKPKFFMSAAPDSNAAINT